MSITVIICRRDKPPCDSCKATARWFCEGPAKGGGTCDRALCETHARKVGEKYFCATHAKSTTNANMPTPPGRKKAEAEP